MKTARIGLSALLALSLALGMTACGSNAGSGGTSIGKVTQTPAATPAPTKTAIPTPTATPTPTEIPMPEPTPEEDPVVGTYTAFAVDPGEYYKGITVEIDAVHMTSELILEEGGTGSLEISSSSSSVDYDIVDWEVAGGRLSIETDVESLKGTVTDGIIRLDYDNNNYFYYAKEDADISGINVMSAEDFQKLLGKEVEEAGGLQAGEYKLISGYDPTGDELLTAQLSQTGCAMYEVVYGMTAILTLNDDGTGTMDMFGSVSELEWDKAGIYVNGEAIPVTLEDDILTIDVEGNTMSFRKLTGEDEELAYNWEEFAPVFEEEFMDGDFVTFKDEGIKIYIPDAYEAEKLTQSDIDDGLIGYYTSDEEVPGSDKTADISFWYYEYDVSLGELLEFAKSSDSVDQESVRIININSIPFIYCEMPDSDVISFTTIRDGHCLEAVFYPLSSYEVRELASMLMTSLQEI